MQSVIGVTLFVVFAVFSAMTHAQSSTIKAVFYDLVDFGEPSFEVTMEEKDGVKECANLPDSINDLASSVNTLGNCIMAFEDKDCEGPKTAISPSTKAHNILGTIGWANKISSVKMC